MASGQTDSNESCASTAAEMEGGVYNSLSTDQGVTQNFMPNSETSSGDVCKQSQHVETVHNQSTGYESTEQLYGVGNTVLSEPGRSESRYSQGKVLLPGEVTRESLADSAQELIDDLNAKRKRDTQLLEDYRKAMEMQVQKSYSVVEQRMFLMYEKQGKLIQDKLQALFAGLDRINKVEGELAQFKQALQVLYQDLQGTE